MEWKIYLMTMSYKQLEEYADKMRIERNSYLIDLKIAEDRIKELEDEIQKRK